MKHHSKLIQREDQQHAAEQHTAQQQTAREFASVEEMLRFDAAQTDVPPDLTRKIQETVAGLPAPKQPWWRLLFGR